MDFKTAFLGPSIPFPTSSTILSSTEPTAPTCTFVFNFKLIEATYLVRVRIPRFPTACQEAYTTEFFVFAFLYIEFGACSLLDL